MALPAAAQGMSHEHGAATGASGMQTPTVAFDRHGTLWRVWVDGKRILVASSSDRARTFGAPVELTRDPEDIDANSESRPKIAIGPAGEIYVSWTRYGAKPYTGDIRFTRSVDGGRTFDSPRTINDDGIVTGHRLDALDVGRDGTVYLVWIDKRDLERATAAGKGYDGAALYYTVSQDHGATFVPNRKIKDHVCECCRIAHAFDVSGRLTLFWRDVMTGSIRDHAMVHLSPDGVTGTVQRVTTDGWQIAACPHHGPWLAFGAAGLTHIVWFTGAGPQGPGAFYGRLSASGHLIGTPIRLGPALPSTGHAVVEAVDDHVVVAWKEGDNRGARVRVMESLDGGATFGAVRTLSETSGPSDHPFLIKGPSGVMLSWYTTEHGYRLLPVSGGAASAR
ncbi:MAG: exo-alpha-sialidase [Vicinamibacterales bacterium]